MYLEKLSLQFFRNYYQEEIKFCSSNIILIGDNAQGKSNLLEAIALLSTLKSYRHTKDQFLIQNNEENSYIKGYLKRKLSDYELSINLRKNGRRTIHLNGENIKRNSDFLGCLNTVFFSSLDIDLVKGSPEYRRNWVDSLLIQLQPIYDHILKEYYHVLKQRNALLKELKNIAENNDQINSDQTLKLEYSRELQLKIWNDKLAEIGTRIMRRRARVINKIAPLAKQWHLKISNEKDIFHINYCPHIPYFEDDPIFIKESILKKIEQRRIAELTLGTTLIGVHRDEVEFSINDTPTRFYGSQGQQRTLVLSLKLAELQLIKEVIGDSPILLLDDVFAELDNQRQNQLLNALQILQSQTSKDLQTFITTTNLNSIDSSLLNNAQIFKVENGKMIAN